MSWEDPAVAALRERLRETDVPPSRLRAGSLVAAAALRNRARRTATTVAALAGVLSLPVLYLAVPESGGPAPGASATATAVPTDPSDAGCTETRLPVPAYVTGGWEVTSVAPNGRYAVGQSFGGSGEPSRFWLWRDWTPVELTGLDQASLRKVLVNSAGVVVGEHGSPTAVRATLLRDGRTHQLSLPAGYVLASVVAISERGDVLATVHTSASTTEIRPTLAVWRGSAPGTAQILARPAGIRYIASGGFATDGRVVASAEVDGRSPIEFAANMRVYTFDLDGTPRLLTPPGTWQTTEVFMLRGDLLYTSIRNRGVPNPTPSPRAGEVLPGWASARWNLRTGEVTVLYERTHFPIQAASDTGWLVLRAHPEILPVTRVDRVSPDGRVQHLPYVEKRRADVEWISPDGRTVVVDTVPTPDGSGLRGPYFAVLWRCAA